MIVVVKVLRIGPHSYVGTAIGLVRADLLSTLRNPCLADRSGVRRKKFAQGATDCRACLAVI